MAGREHAGRWPGSGAGRNGAAAFALALALAGCGSSPLLTYDLTAPRDPPARAIGMQIVVTEPAAIAPLDADRIVVRSATQGLTVLPGAQWSDRLPELVQSRMIQAFENARLLKAVGRPGDRLVPDYNLVSEIRRFEIDAARGEAIVEIAVKLVGDRSGRIAAARVFEARAPSGAGTGAEASATLDRALAQVLRELVAWTARGRR